MSTTSLSRFVKVSTSCLIMAGFLGFAPIVSADEVVTPTDEKAHFVQIDVENLSAALVADVRTSLNDRLHAEMALMFDPATQTDTLQANVVK